MTFNYSFLKWCLFFHTCSVRMHSFILIIVCKFYIFKIFIITESVPVFFYRYEISKLHSFDYSKCFTHLYYNWYNVYILVIIIILLNDIGINMSNCIIVWKCVPVIIIYAVKALHNYTLTTNTFLHSWIMFESILSLHWNH